MMRIMLSYRALIKLKHMLKREMTSEEYFFFYKVGTGETCFLQPLFVYIINENGLCFVLNGCGLTVHFVCCLKRECTNLGRELIVFFNPRS